MPHIESLYRYPVKGLSPEPLETVTLQPGETFPFDRAYAIENGPSGFEPKAPGYFPKIAFLMLMRDERLAALKTRFDDATRTLTVRQNGAVVAEGSLETASGRRAIEAFFDAFAVEDLRGPAKVLHAPGHSFSDTARKVVSLISRASLRDLERHTGVPVHPLRFRGNVYVDDLPPWQEFEWLGREIHVGKVRLKALERIDRCAATNVNPDTAERDLTIPRTLLEAYGHPDCGIFLEVVAGGEMKVGYEIQPG